MYWLVLMAGMALVTACFAGAATYLGLERRMHSSEALSATLDRLYQTQQLSAGLKTLHNGNTEIAAQRLDLLLAENILSLNAGLAHADDRERAAVKDVLARIARQRPMNLNTTASATPEINNDLIEVEKILAQMCVEVTRAN
jgi:hypothetical protein